VVVEDVLSKEGMSREWQERERERHACTRVARIRVGDGGGGLQEAGGGGVCVGGGGEEEYNTALANCRPITRINFHSKWGCT
jgi:hypothetical protein